MHRRRSQLTPSPSGPRGLLRALGPGLVTGAADDDPSGIATYSQVGAQFGYQLSWAIFVSFPLMAATQALCVRIGAVSGEGIAGNLRRHYPRWILHVSVLLLLVANIFNIGADLGAMGAALTLLIGGSQHGYTIAFGLVCVGLEVWLSYARYSAILKWLTLSLFAYVAVVLVVGVPWSEVARSIVAPQLEVNSAQLTALVAVFGTTISPYLFFWQTDQEVEELHAHHERPLRRNPGAAANLLAQLGWDTGLGMALSGLVALAIMVATAATLHAHGITRIDSAAQAAAALAPIAGPFAFLLFALGIIGTGLLAVPVLAGSAAYAVAETWAWTASLDARPDAAPAFYGVIAAATLAGLGLNFVPIDPMRALYLAAVLNGVLAAPLLAVIMLLVADRRVMGQLTPPRWLLALGWLTTAVMAAVTVGVFLL